MALPTKAEFLTTLAAMTYVDKVGTPVPMETPNEWGDQKYRVGIRKRSGNCVNYEYIHFVAIGEFDVLPKDKCAFLKDDRIVFENAQEHFNEGVAVPAPTPKTTPGT